MFDEQRIYEYGGLLAAGYGLYQARKIHNTELEKARQRHAEAIALAKKQHEADMKTVKQTYLLELFNSLEQHFQQLNADLIASSRESERDMFDQRNQSFQTIILASSVMFSALASMIVDGNLPLNSGPFLLIAYAMTCSLSFCFLFLSAVFCIELVIRTSSFMYRRGKSHTRNLRNAIHDTKKMMSELRGEGKGNSAMPRVQSSVNFADNKANVMRRAISRMQPSEIEEEFERHEAEIRGYLKKREVLNDSAAVTSYRDEVTGVKRPFKHFWEESCETWWNLSILLFYGGSLNMLLALMIYMYAQFAIHYDSVAGAVVGVSLLGLVLVLGIGTVIVMRHVDSQIDKRENMDWFINGPPEDARRNQFLQQSSSSSFPGGTDAGLEAGGASRSWNRFPFAGRHGTAAADGAGAVPGPPRASAAAHTIGAVPTDSTDSVTPRSSADLNNMAIGVRPGIAFPLPSQSHSTPGLPTQLSTPLRSGNGGGHRGAVESLPGRLDTHYEDVETGSMMTDTSVNSAFTLPPGARGDHIFHEEPSPRRKFLSAFGSHRKQGSGKAASAQGGTPSSLLRTALGSGGSRGRRASDPSHSFATPEINARHSQDQPHNLLHTSTPRTQGGGYQYQRRSMESSPGSTQNGVADQHGGSERSGGLGSYGYGGRATSPSVESTSASEKGAIMF